MGLISTRVGRLVHKEIGHTNDEIGILRARTTLEARSLVTPTGLLATCGNLR